MEQKILRINENTDIAENVFKIVLEGDIEEPLPGQFVNIKIPGKYLRRPISVCDYEPGALTLCYKTVGEGTEILSTLKAGEALDVLTGLGNGYDLTSPGNTPLLIGGGMGTAPLFYLARTLKELYTSLEVAIGFNSRNEIFYKEEFENLGCRLTISTVDGSFGTKGFVTDILPKKYSSFFACGPLPMMKAVNKAAKTSGQFSLEERMGCGFGACMGCSIKVKSDPAPGGAAASADRAKVKSGISPAGDSEFRIPDPERRTPNSEFQITNSEFRTPNSKFQIPNSELTPPVLYKRICKDGPVFKREEIIWED